MKLKRMSWWILAASCFVLAVAACDDRAFEKAGKAVDRAGEKAGNKIKEIVK